MTLMLLVPLGMEALGITSDRPVVSERFLVAISNPDFQKRTDYYRRADGIIDEELNKYDLEISKYPVKFEVIHDGINPQGTELLINDFQGGGYSDIDLPSRTRVSVEGILKVSEVSYGKFEVVIEFKQTYRGAGCLAYPFLIDRPWILGLTDDLKRRLINSRTEEKHQE